MLDDARRLIRALYEQRKAAPPKPADSRFPHITCPVCSMTSYHRDDIRYGWCAKCCRQTSKCESDRITSDWQDNKDRLDRGKI